MDERLAALERAVARAADAWVNDVRDHEAYRRLILPVEARRAYLNPPLPQTPPVDDPPISTPVHEQDAELLDEMVGSVRPLGHDLTGDPRDVLARLAGRRE